MSHNLAQLKSFSQLKIGDTLHFSANVSKCHLIWQAHHSIPVFSSCVFVMFFSCFFFFRAVNNKSNNTLNECCKSDSIQPKQQSDIIRECSWSTFPSWQQNSAGRGYPKRSRHGININEAYWLLRVALLADSLLLQGTVC